MVARLRVAHLVAVGFVPGHRAEATCKRTASSIRYSSCSIRRQPHCGPGRSPFRVSGGAVQIAAVRTTLAGGSKVRSTREAPCLIGRHPPAAPRSGRRASVQSASTAPPRPFPASSVADRRWRFTVIADNATRAGRNVSHRVRQRSPGTTAAIMPLTRRQRRRLLDRQLLQQNGQHPQRPASSACLAQGPPAHPAPTVTNFRAGDCRHASHPGGVGQRATVNLLESLVSSRARGTICAAGRTPPAGR